MRMISFGMRSHLFFVGLAFTIGIGLLIDTSLRAGIITQGAGENWVGFEAEGTGVITGDAATTWHNISDLNASDGYSLESYGSSSGEATYQIQFSNTTQQTYYIYARMRSAPRDGYGYNSTKISDHDDVGIVNNIDGTHSGTSYNISATAETYKWATTGLLSFVVPANYLGTFVARIKSGGVVVDRFYLSTNNTLTDANFPTFTNSDILVPEPSSTAVAIILAGAALLRRRRPSGC